MHDILILTEPVELWNAKNHNTKCTISNSHWTSGVGGNAKITTQMHDILILTEPVGGNAKITTQMHDILILTEPVELVGMLKSQLKCTIS
jgi:ribosomal protein S27E